MSSFLQKTYKVVLLSLCALTARATVYEGRYGQAELIDTTSTSGIVTEIAFLTPYIVNVRHYLPACTVEKRDYVVTLAKQDVDVSVTETTTYTEITSEGLTVRYILKTGLVLFMNQSGTVILRERSTPSITATTDGAYDSYTVGQSFTLKSGEVIYGLGQIQDGNLNHRGLTYSYMYEGNTTVWIPYIHSTNGYALYWDNPSPTTFTDNTSDGMSFESTVGYGVDYYVMLGDETDGNVAIGRMRELTGDVPLLPLWAYGYIQSKERYQSADEVMGVGHEYRRLGVPIDCVVQDWQYWGDNNYWNAQAFLSENYSNYQEMLDSLHNMDEHLMISIWANFGRDTEQQAYLKANDLLIKQGDEIMTDTYPSDEGVAIYNTYSSDARDYYWSGLYSGLASKGVDGYWLDSSEPDHYQSGDDLQETFDYEVLPSTTWRSVRNLFPLMHVSGVYEHHRAQSDLAAKRCMILTRSAYAGQQRTGANTWSGDITASWDMLRKEVAAALNFTVTGNPNWNSDIGGFFNGDLGGPGNTEYNELYARWLQFGTFCPMMRSHGSGTDKAIYVWGRRGEEYFDNAEKYINMRYALLPYIYSTAWNVCSERGSFMTALGVAFPQDDASLEEGEEFLFGESVLVTPVCEYGARSYDVYLPSGADWVNFWTGESHGGGATVSTDAALDVIPLYVKAGSIVPWARKAMYADIANWDTLQIRIYPGADATFTLYEDEGNNYNYENGSYATITFSWSDASNTLEIGAREGSFDGMLTSRVFDVLIVSEELGTGNEVSDQVNARVDYDGSALTVTIDPTQLIDVEYDDEDLEMDTSDMHFDLDDFEPDINGDGTYANGYFRPTAQGFGGWWDLSINLTGYNYLVAELSSTASSYVSLRAYAENDYASIPVACRSDGTSSTLCLDLSDISNITGCGLWSASALKIGIEDVYLTSEKPEGTVCEGNSAEYEFVATEWTTGDEGRVSQSNISYDETANTITLNATGTNNTALQLDLSKSDIYYISGERKLMCVKVSNVSEDLSDSKLWFAFGMHLGEVDATEVVTAQDGDAIVVWDLSSELPDRERNFICLGSSFLFCFGLTSTTGTSVVSDIGFYSEDEVAYIGTGITQVSSGAETVRQGAYTLSGLKLNSTEGLPKGIYIVNGKKVVI